MGSENRQKSLRCNLKSVVTLLFPPRFDRAASKTRRYLPERLNLPQSGSMRGAERLRVLDESCELRSQTWGELTASRRTSETWVSTSDGSRSPSSSSCRTALAVCRHRAPCQPSSVIGTSVSLRRIDRACYQDRCDVHSDTSDDTDSPTRRAAKTLSTRATRSRPHSCSDITDHDERRRSAPLGHATGARRLRCDFRMR